jgi:hypothetical protein
MNSLRRVVPLLAVGLLLLGAVLSALLATPQIRPVAPPKPPMPTVNVTATGKIPPAAAPEADTPNPDDHPVGVQVPEWLMGIAQILCLVAVVGVVVLVFWLLLRSGLRTRERKLTEEPAASPEATREHVLAAVDAGLTELDDSDADPRRAVIACWVRLEQAAADAGTPRAPGDTPTDLVGRLLAEQQVSAIVLYPLAEVYRLARYAAHAVDTTMRDQARAALGHLRAELSRTGTRQVVG